MLNKFHHTANNSALKQLISSLYTRNPLKFLVLILRALLISSIGLVHHY